MSPSFHIDQRLGSLPDPQKTWTWELAISDISSIVPGLTSDDLTIRCRSASLPGRGSETIESSFFGMKQKFASKPTFGMTLAVSFEEFEDQKMSKALYAWNNKIFDTNFSSAQAGGSQAVQKRSIAGKLGYATNIFLNQYTYDRTKLEKSVKFFNAFPQDVGDVGLDYAGSGSVIYNVTFSYDRWELV